MIMTNQLRAICMTKANLRRYAEVKSDPFQQKNANKKMPTKKCQQKNANKKTPPCKTLTRQ